MKLKHWTIPHLDGVAWHGYERGEAYNEDLSFAQKQLDQEARMAGCYSEREAELDCFLSILADTSRSEITLMECGAGWGEWCLGLAGVVNKRLMPHQIKRWRAVAVEGDPEVFKMMQENRRTQGLLFMECLQGVVSDKSGLIRFNTGDYLRRHCGGTAESPSWLMGLWNLWATIKGDSKVLSSYTIDQIAHYYGVKHLDMLHLDVQGSELRALCGAKNTLPITDYVYVGTHSQKLHREVKEVLSPIFGEAKADVAPNTTAEIQGIGNVMCPRGQDGILLFARTS